MDDAAERLIVKQSFEKVISNVRISPAQFTITYMSQLSSWLLSSFCPCEKRQKKSQPPKVICTCGESQLEEMLTW